MKTFEDYLKENHAKNYRGLDDEMPDAYEAWVSDLDLSTVMQLAEDAIKEQVREEDERIIKLLQANIWEGSNSFDIESKMHNGIIDHLIRQIAK